MNAEGRRFALALAAASAGLAVGVKLSLLAPVLALTVGAVVLAPGARRRASAALWLIPLGLAGGFWYVRNLIAVGNPLPWVSVPGLTRPAPPLQEHTAFSVAHYLTNTHIWSTVFEPGLAAGLGPWWAVILALAVLGPVMCLLPGADGRLRMLGLVALVSLVAYLLTPESAAGPAGAPLGFAFNLRYGAPALILSLTILPLAPALGGDRRRVIVAVGLGIVLVATLAQARLWPSRHAAVAAAIGIVVFVLAALSGPAAAPAPAGGRARGRVRGAGDPAHRRCRRRLLVAAPLPSRALRVLPGRLLPGEGVGVVPPRAPSPGGHRGHVRRVLLLSALRRR